MSIKRRINQHRLRSQSTSQVTVTGITSSPCNNMEKSRNLTQSSSSRHWKIKVAWFWSCDFYYCTERWPVVTESRVETEVGTGPTAKGTENFPAFSKMFISSCSGYMRRYICQNSVNYILIKVCSGETKLLARVGICSAVDANRKGTLRYGWRFLFLIMPCQQFFLL